MSSFYLGDTSSSEEEEEEEEEEKEEEVKTMDVYSTSTSSNVLEFRGSSFNLDLSCLWFSKWHVLSALFAHSPDALSWYQFIVEQYRLSEVPDYTDYHFIQIQELHDVIANRVKALKKDDVDKITLSWYVGFDTDRHHDHKLASITEKINKTSLKDAMERIEKKMGCIPIAPAWLRTVRYTLYEGEAKKEKEEDSDEDSDDDDEKRKEEAIFVLSVLPSEESHRLLYPKRSEREFPFIDFLDREGDGSMSRERLPVMHTEEMGRGVNVVIAQCDDDSYPIGLSFVECRIEGLQPSSIVKPPDEQLEGIPACFGPRPIISGDSCLVGINLKNLFTDSSEDWINISREVTRKIKGVVGVDKKANQAIHMMHTIFEVVLEKKKVEGIYLLTPTHYKLYRPVGQDMQTFLDPNTRLETNMRPLWMVYDEKSLRPKSRLDHRFVRRPHKPSVKNSLVKSVDTKKDSMVSSMINSFANLSASFQRFFLADPTPEKVYATPLDELILFYEKNGIKCVDLIGVIKDVVATKISDCVVDTIHLPEDPEDFFLSFEELKDLCKAINDDVQSTAGNLKLALGLSSNVAIDFGVTDNGERIISIDAAISGIKVNVFWTPDMANNDFNVSLLLRYHDSEFVYYDIMAPFDKDPTTKKPFIKQDDIYTWVEELIDGMNKGGSGPAKLPLSLGVKADDYNATIEFEVDIETDEENIGGQVRWNALAILSDNEPVSLQPYDYLVPDESGDPDRLLFSAKSTFCQVLYTIYSLTTGGKTGDYSDFKIPDDPGFLYGVGLYTDEIPDVASSLLQFLDTENVVVVVETETKMPGFHLGLMHNAGETTYGIIKALTITVNKNGSFSFYPRDLSARLFTHVPEMFRPNMKAEPESDDFKNESRVGEYPVVRPLTRKKLHGNKFASIVSAQRKGVTIQGASDFVEDGNDDIVVKYNGFRMGNVSLVGDLDRYWFSEKSSVPFKLSKKKRSKKANERGLAWRIFKKE
jgi:ribosomal protein L12E/L44/L45/RPP1/RPP2